MSERNDVVLRGCGTRPLVSYLKAIGVLRTIGTQADPSAAGYWKGESFVVRTVLSVEGICDFLLGDFRPTPLVVPWNGRTGFMPGDTREKAQVVKRIEASRSPRLVAFRAAIDAARNVVAEAESKGWFVLKADGKRSIQGANKLNWIKYARSLYPDGALDALDALSIVVDGDVVYPPLLGGTGGVMGSFDVTANLLEALETTIGLEDGARPRNSAELLRYAVFGVGSPRLATVSGGQFNPGSKSTGLSNPWDFVLAIEGAAMFSSGASRRLGSQRGGLASVPFAVSSSPVGYGTATAEKSRAELWMPIWTRSMRIEELAKMLSEGRSEWSRRQARTGIDWVRAMASLGVDRAIGGFERFGILERDGQDNVAVPMGRLCVVQQPRVEILASLDRWLDTVRGLATPPESIRSNLRRVDSAQWDAATGHGPLAFQSLLYEVASLERTISYSRDIRKKVAPAPRVMASEWWSSLDDGSVELRIAAALTSQTDSTQMTFSSMIRPAAPTQAGKLEWRLAPIGGLDRLPLTPILAAISYARVSCQPAAAEQGVVVPVVGSVPAFRYRKTAVSLALAADFLDGLVDEQRLSRLVAGLSMLDWSGCRWIPGLSTIRRAIPSSLSVLAPFFSRDALPVPGDDSAEGVKVSLRPSPRWPVLLAAGRVDQTIEEALLRLRIAGFEPISIDPKRSANGVDGVRLAAALVLPLTSAAVSAAVRRVCPTDEDPASEFEPPTKSQEAP